MSPDPLTFHIDDKTSMRQAAIEDADRLFAVVDANRDYLRRWLPWLDGSTRADDTCAFLSAVVERGRAGLGRVWLIEHARALCGVVGLNRVEPVNRVCEIGYWLDASHQGRGIMTRCAARLVRHAFEDLRLNRITIPVAVENVRSRAIPERLGFHAEGIMREAEWLYDHFVDHVLYALIRSDHDRQSVAR
jgi:ribosomal-protein-serine acetyltransferase